MNERIKQLAKQAGMHYRKIEDEFCEANKDGVPMILMERFAELVRQDERKKWVSLTKEEIIGHTCECVDDGTFDMNCVIDFANAIQQTLKKANT